MTGIVTSLQQIADSLYGVRDVIGAIKQPVYLVARTWTGAQVGLGTYNDVVTQMLPTPNVIDLASDFTAQQGGNYEEGDMMLKGVSKQSWYARELIDCTSVDRQVEKFYKVADKLYSVLHVEESYICWNVRIRKTAHTG